MDYEHNSVGWDSGDRNACFPKALAVAFGTSFSEARNLCQGRKVGHTTPWPTIDRILDDLGARIETIYDRPEQRRPTLSRFASEHPTGTYLVFTQGHALTLIDGKVIDTVSPRPRCIVRRYARLF